MAKQWEDMSVAEKEEYLRRQKAENADKELAEQVLLENEEREEKSKRIKYILIGVAVFIAVALIIIYIICNWQMLKDAFMKGYNGEFIKMIKGDITL